MEFESSNQEEHDWARYQKQYQMERVFKTLKKYHFRNFMNNFKSSVIQKLLKHNSKPEIVYILQKAHDDWPYKALFLKKNKTEHEKLQLEFVSMCAEKIQSVFKGHLVLRRHLLAVKRLKAFKATALALIKGWKVRQIREEMKTIRVKKAEVVKEQKTLSQTNNKYSIRKLEYLQKSLEDEVTQFMNKFNHLYFTGGWTFQPKIQRPAKQQKIQKWNKSSNTKAQIQQNFNQPQTQLQEPIPNNQPSQISQPRQRKAQKPKRVRQMRNNGQKKQQKVLEQTSTNEFIQEQLKALSNNGPSSSASTLISEDRPIQAKGAYKIDQSNLNIQQQETKLKGLPENTEQTADTNDKKTQNKQTEKKKIQKRQKYDPRKALLQQKQKKKELQEKQAQQAATPHQTEPNSVKEIPHPPLQKQKTERQVKSQKSIKPNEKQETANRSTVVGASKVNKGKVGAKIDCWGNRKTVVKKLPDRESNPSFSSVVEAPEIQQTKNYSDLITLQKIRSKIQEQGRSRAEQFQQERHTAKIDEREQMRKDRSTEMLKRMPQQDPKMTKGQSLTAGLKQKQRMAEQQKRKEIIYRPVEQLEETYNNQYINRFQNLMPKLGLLTAARSAEKLSPIPVLPVKSAYVDKMMSENVISQRFWQTVSKMEKRVKEFISA